MEKINTKEMGIYYHKKGIKFEDEYEKALKDMHVNYVRGHMTSWDFLILAPFCQTYIELKENNNYLSKKQKEFMKEHWDNYLLIIRKKNKYFIKQYCNGRLRIEKIFDNDIYKIAFYPVFRMMAGFTYIRDNTPYMKNIDLNENYTTLSLKNAMKYLNDFKCMNPFKNGFNMTLLPIAYTKENDYKRLIIKKVTTL